MKKYNVKVYTTSDDLLVDCILDEFNLGEFLDCTDTDFLRLEDDARDLYYLFNISQIVCIEWKEVKE